MVEYALLSAESAKQLLGGWVHRIEPATVVPILAVAFLAWIVWRVVRG